MLVKIAHFLLKNNSNAAFVAFVCALFPFVHLPIGGLLAALIVGLVTLQKGVKDGLVVLFWVAPPVIALLLLGRIGSFDMFFVRCMLVWLFAAVLLKKHGWTPVLACSLLLGFFAVAVLHFVLGDPAAWWVRVLSNYLSVAQQASELQIPQQEITRITQLLAPVASGIAVAALLFSVTIVLALARAWQSHVYNPGGFRREILHIRLGHIALGLVVLNIIGVALGNKMLLDFLPVLSFPFVVAGMSLLHCLATKYKTYLALLFLSYAMLMFIPFVAWSIWVLAAIVDCCLNVRTRLKLIND